MMALGGMAQSTFLAIVRGDASQAVTEFNKLGRAVEKSTVGAGKDVSKFKTVTSGAFAQIKANAGLMAAGAGAAIAGFAVKAVNDFSRLGVAVGQFADATGFSTEAASRLIEVAGDINVDVSALEGGINKMNKALGASPAKFEALGVSVVYANDGAIDMSATFLNAIDVVNGIEDPTRKAATATAIFGRGWTSMAELIAQGSETIAKSMDEVDASKVMSADDIKQAREYRDAMKDLSDKFEEFSLVVGKRLVPALTDATEAAEGFLSVLDYIPGGAGTGASWLRVLSGDVRALPGLFDGLINAARESSFAVNDAEASGGGDGGFGARGAEKAADAMDDLTEANQRTAEAFRDASKAADEYRKSIEDAYHAERAILGNTLDYEEAVGDATKAVNEANQSLVDSTATAEDQQDAMIDARDAIIDASEAYVEMHGASLDSATGVGMQISELERLRDTLGANDPLRMAIDEYIAQLKLIPQSIATRLELRVSQGKVLSSSGDVLGANTGATGTGGPRAAGGPVSAGQTYLVGEKGPELVTMGASGFVTPNNRLGGGNTTTIVNVYPRTMPTDTELIDLVSKIRRRGGQI